MFYCCHRLSDQQPKIATKCQDPAVHLFHLNWRAGATLIKAMKTPPSMNSTNVRVLQASHKVVAPSSLPHHHRQHWTHSTRGVAAGCAADDDCGAVAFAAAAGGDGDYDLLTKRQTMLSCAADVAVVDDDEIDFGNSHRAQALHAFAAVVAGHDYGRMYADWSDCGDAVDGGCDGDADVAGDDDWQPLAT